jgi:hypothetical protein
MPFADRSGRRPVVSMPSAHPREELAVRRSLAFMFGFVVVGGVAVAGPAQADPEEHKVTICHGAVDHYELVTVDEHALAGHMAGTDGSHGYQNLPDVFPNLDGSCGEVGPPM